VVSEEIVRGRFGSVVAVTVSVTDKGREGGEGREGTPGGSSVASCLIQL
jgi:hypothetical protein